MQRREVAELFAQDEEKRVEKVDKLGDEVPPGHVEGLHGRPVPGVVDGLAPPVVVVPPEPAARSLQSWALSVFLHFVTN